MKKSAISILFLLSITFTNAQNLDNTVIYEKLNLKPIESVFDEQDRKIDKETKALRVNFSEYFPAEAKETNDIVFSFLKAKQDIYGLTGNLDNTKIIGTTDVHYGKYVYCQQYINNIPVFATNFIVQINNDNVVTCALNEFRNISKYKEIENKPFISNSEALEIVYNHLNIKSDKDIIGEPKTELTYFESIDNGLELTWKINVVSMNPHGDWQAFVNANNKNIIHLENIMQNANGTGKIFNPNPLVSANTSYGGSYIHNNNANSTFLTNQLKTVTLNDITYENGLYKLIGPYCVVTNINPPNGHNIPQLSTPNFNYSRNQEEFEAVMSYYHIDACARRILQLGFNIPNELKYFGVDPHGDTGRNAYYTPTGNCILLGSSLNLGNTFVNAAQDADVIWHEYGHAIQQHLAYRPMSYSNSETQSVKEGSSDYWATSYKRSLYPNNNWSQMGIWFEMGSSSRRTDLNLIYPNDYNNFQNNHDKGQVWSSALMEIWGLLGRDVTDKLFLDAHLSWGASPTMRDAAYSFLSRDIYEYEGDHYCTIFNVFKKRGLIINTTWHLTDNFTTNYLIVANDVRMYQNAKISNNARVTVKACNEVKIDNCEVKAGSTLDIKTDGYVIINPGFKVEADASFIVK